MEIIKYESDFTVRELISMGHIDEFVRPIVLALNDKNIYTTSSCQGHKRNHHGIYAPGPWVDIDAKDSHKLIDLLMNYPDKNDIVLNFWDNPIKEGGAPGFPTKHLTIFPRGKGMKKGREIFNKFAEYLNEQC